jgi:hypothetical protein
MNEIQKIKKRLENIFRELTKHYYNKEAFKKELESITKQIYQEVDKASKEDRKELDNLIMLKNIIKAKIK